MLRRIWMHCFVAGALLFTTNAAQAQRTQDQSLPLPPPPGLLLGGDIDAGPMDNQIELLGFEPGPVSQVVKNAPFSAEAVTETERILGDGNRIHRRTESKLYRDSAGRMRREGALPTFGLFITSDQSRKLTSIYDAMTETNYILDPDLKIARALPALPALPRLPAGDLKDKHREPDIKQAPGKPAVESLGAGAIEANCHRSGTLVFT